MILGGDFHRPGEQVSDRMIGTMVAEFQFAGFSPQRQPQYLMPQADAEHRDIGVENLADGRNGVIAGLGVARSVGQEYAVKLVRWRKQIDHHQHIRGGLFNADAAFADIHRQGLEGAGPSLLESRSFRMPKSK